MRRYFCLLAVFALSLCFTTTLLATGKDTWFGKPFSMARVPLEERNRVADEMIVKLKQTKAHQFYSSNTVLNTVSFKDLLHVDIRSDGNLDLIRFVDTTSVFTKNYNYKSFDMDEDGYTDLGFIHICPNTAENGGNYG